MSSNISGEASLRIIKSRPFRVVALSLLLLLFIFPSLLAAQRLPGNVVPDHYSLTFTPDLQTATFSGEEVIDVRVTQPGAAITLNAAELEFQSATVTQNGATQTAQVAPDAAQEQATLTVPAALAAGPATIQIRFTGILNDKLRGFYLAKSAQRNYATTQFEATDARRAFPSFDEPALKAKFDITLVVDKGDTAISNGKIISDTPGPVEGKHTLKFSTTKKMSSYLVAMAVGDLQCLEGEADGIPIRVCGTPDKKPLSAAALRYAQEILKFYDQYYGIKYPFEKLDIVGVPDFSAGAMENTAAIFYRESLLFIDDNHSSVGAHQAVFEVLAHEMAHQWFGDLVTMKWWDNLWLNEGFATWMALKPSQALHPEWNAAQDAVSATQGALAVDSLRNTHPIRAKAETPDEINELFDAISYEKAAAVLRMIEAYVNPDVFRHGVNIYLNKFAYSNATAEDFWHTIAVASGRPVDKIMPTFVNQPGEPVVTVSAECVTPPAVQERSRHRRGRKARTPAKPQPRTEITVSQRRFLLDDNGAGAGNELWMIPLCVKSADSKPFCQIVGERQQKLPISGCSEWVFTNANAVGYYRTHYGPELFRKLSNVAQEKLNTQEKMSLVSDVGALMRAGEEKVGTLLDWITVLSQEPDRSVVESYQTYIESINDRLLTAEDRQAFHQWVRATLRSMMTKIGWTRQPGEKEDTTRLRADLIYMLGEIGEDPEVARQSSEMAHQYLQNPDSVDATIAGEVLRVAAQFGDAKLFDEYVNALHKTTSPEQYYNIADALSRFVDPQLVARALERDVSPEVRSQDAGLAISSFLSNPETRATAWDWIKSHWIDVEKKTAAHGAGIVAGTGNFCTAEAREDVQRFFTEHKVASSERALRQAVERINSCIAYRQHQQADLAAWLGQHNGAANAGGK